MIFDILMFVVSVLSGMLGGYVLYRLRARKVYWKWLPVVHGGAIPGAIYYVRQIDPSGFVKVLYEGDDLQYAKKAYKGVTMPSPTLVELYTHGQHTAGRNV